MRLPPHAIAFAIPQCLFFFFFNDTATTEIYTLSLHDALPICRRRRPIAAQRHQRVDLLDAPPDLAAGNQAIQLEDRKSTRLNSSHLVISYAVFCLKKKKRKECSSEIDLTPVPVIR